MTNERPNRGADTDDGDEPEVARRECADCGAQPPPTETVHTLISSKHGWRLRRVQDPAKGVAYEWRCPACWKALKERTP